MGTAELVHAAVGQLLHPALERVPAVDAAGRIGVQYPDRLVDGGTWTDLVGHHAQLVLDAPQFVERPQVRLVPGEGGAEEVPAGPRVAFRPGRRPVPPVWRELGPQEPAGLGGRLDGAPGGPVEVGAQRGAAAGPPRQPAT